MTQRTLYEVTGDIKDVNTLLINRNDWQAAQAQATPATDTELINRGCRYETELTQATAEPVAVVHGLLHGGVSAEILPLGVPRFTLKAGDKLYTAPPDHTALLEKALYVLVNGGTRSEKLELVASITKVLT